MDHFFYCKIMHIHLHFYAARTISLNDILLFFISNAIRKWNDAPDTVLPTIQKLLDAGLRIWIFSGDTDGRVPVTATRYSIKEMKLKTKEEWRAWFYKKQVGGWVVTYNGGLTFLTVRGAGHQVPMFAPPQSLSLFSHFISGTPLPSTRF